MVDEPSRSDQLLLRRAAQTSATFPGHEHVPDRDVERELVRLRDAIVLVDPVTLDHRVDEPGDVAVADGDPLGDTGASGGEQHVGNRGRIPGSGFPRVRRLERVNVGHHDRRRRSA